jgi:hypothetical protein
MYLEVSKFHLYFAGLYKKLKEQLSYCQDKHDVSTEQREPAFSFGVITNILHIGTMFGEYR